MMTLQQQHEGHASSSAAAAAAATTPPRPLYRKLLGLYTESDVNLDRVEGAVCVVTGANSGVGYELCASLCRLGAGAIFAVGRDEDKLRAAAQALEGIALESARARLEAFQRRAALPPTSAAAAAAVAVPALSPTLVVPLIADLEHAGEVARCAFSIEARAPHVDYVILCAGRYVDAPFHLAEGWGPHAAPVAGGEEEEQEEAAERPEWASGGRDKKKPWGIESTMALYYGNALLATMLMPKMLMRAHDMFAQGALHHRLKQQAREQQQQQQAPGQQQQEEQGRAGGGATTTATAATTTTGTATTTGAATTGTATTGTAATTTTTTKAAAPTTTTTTTQQQQQQQQRPASPGGGRGGAMGPTPLRLPPGSRPLPRARIVWVASQAEQYAPALGPFLTDDPTGEKLGTSGMPAYARSKAMGILFVRELARRLALGEARADAAREAAVLGGDQRRANVPTQRRIDAVAVHPGLVDSPLMAKTSVRDYPVTALLSRAGASLIGLSPRQGACALLFALTSPELDGKGGAFVGPSYVTNLAAATVREPVHPDARDPDVWRLNWDATRRVLQRSFRAGSRVAARFESVLGGKHRTLPASA